MTTATENKIRAFTKILHIGRGNNYTGHVFVKIEFTKDGRLSLSGVEGPKPNGDARGSCGQISKPEIWEFAPGWSQDKIDRLWALWEEWHLNDMRPECEHQRALGWLEKGKEKVTQYNWRLDDETHKAQRKLAERIRKDLQETGKADLNNEELRLYGYLWSKETWTQEAPEHYKAPSQSTSPETETKTLGWVRPDEHPEGLLGRPCPTCGYKYGSEWLRVEVPEDVLAELRALPGADIQPAWCQMLAKFARFNLELYDKAALRCFDRTGGPDEAAIHRATRMGTVQAQFKNILPAAIKCELRDTKQYSEDDLDDEALNQERIVWIAANKIEGEICRLARIKRRHREYNEKRREKL